MKARHQRSPRQPRRDGGQRTIISPIRKTMKSTLQLTILAFLTATAVHLSAADVNGKWKSEFESPVGHLKYVFDLKADGDKLSGNAIRELDGEKTETDLKECKLAGDDVSFVEPLKFNDQEVAIEYKGKLSADEIKFTRKVGEFATMEIVATREKASTTDIAGDWKANFDTGIGEQKYVFHFKTDGGKLAGKANAEISGEKYETTLTDLKLDGDKIHFVEPLNFQDNELHIEYKGTISGDEMKLTRQVGDVATEELVARRVKQTAQETASRAEVPATNKLTLKVIKVDSEETTGEDGRGANAVDGDPNTIWHTQWQDESPAHPHEIIIELSAPAMIKGFTYLPRQDEADGAPLVNGTIKDYEFYVSNDGKEFGQPVKKGTFSEGQEKKTVTFDPVQCRFIKLKALSEVNGEAWTSAAEIGVIPE
jgi:F5/8 type C domain